jgi:hypothetical protein
MAKRVILRPDVKIDPIPTGAEGIVRGTTITVKVTAERVEETIASHHPNYDKSESDMNSN